MAVDHARHQHLPVEVDHPRAPTHELADIPIAADAHDHAVVGRDRASPAVALVVEQHLAVEKHGVGVAHPNPNPEGRHQHRVNSANLAE